jgi:hypothetical protein
VYGASGESRNTEKKLSFLGNTSRRLGDRIKQIERASDWWKEGRSERQT